MRILDRYIGNAIFSGTALVLLVLVGLFAFFAFIDELNDVGKARYGIWQAIEYVLWGIPLTLYEIFPSALLIGSLIGLGILANNNELTVLRAAGISVTRIVWAALKRGLLLIIIVISIGEVIAPYGEQYSYEMRALAQSDENRMVFQSRYGFWARENHDFVNIRTIQADGRFGDVRLYQFDDNLHLQQLTHAQFALYQKGEWVLQDVEQITYSYQQEIPSVKRQHFAELHWNAVLNPDLVKIVSVRPHKLSTFGLTQYIEYLKQSGQRTLPYELAWWQRIAYPFVCITMLILAIPFVFGSLRSITIGQRLLIGALFGVGFYMLNQVAGNLGLVYEFPPMLSALMPPLIFLGIALLLTRRNV